ncbi:MAG: methyl-accepting chemotaxis protein [Sulfurimonas sp.]|nr:methyl-accepting chemotaxis protein [Sulfurimonas sp.]
MCRNSVKSLKSEQDGMYEKKGTYFNMNLNIKNQILAGFAVLVLLIAASGAYILNGVSDISGFSSTLKNETYPSLDKTNLLANHLRQTKESLLDSITDSDEDIIEESQKYHDSFIAILKELRQMTRDKELDEIKKLFEGYFKIGKAVALASIEGEDLATIGNKLVNLNETVKMLNSKLMKYHDKKYEEFTSNLDEVKNLSEKFKIVVLITIFLTIIAGVLIGIFLANKIKKPLNQAVDIAHAIAEGNLTRKDIEVKTKDELGDLASSLNLMKQNLNEMIKMVAKVTDNIASSASKLLTSSSEMSSGARQQTSQTNDVATSMEKMNATIIDIAINSTKVATSAQEASDLATKGGEVVASTIDSMHQIAQSVTESATTVEALGKNSEEIGEIIKVIDNIASQTNLLALNAAIEAARAGEHGRGFAVVADEIRKLADRTTSATSEIGNMIEIIQESTKGAVESMYDGTDKVKAGVELADQAGESLRQIVSAAHNVLDMVQQIAVTAEQQSARGKEITANIESVSNVAKQTAFSAQQSAKDSEGLGNLAIKLQDLVAKFQINK